MFGLGCFLSNFIPCVYASSCPMVPSCSSYGKYTWSDLLVIPFLHIDSSLYLLLETPHLKSHFQFLTPHPDFLVSPHYLASFSSSYYYVISFKKLLDAWFLEQCSMHRRCAKKKMCWKKIGESEHKSLPVLILLGTEWVDKSTSARSYFPRGDLFWKSYFLEEILISIILPWEVLSTL